jgi:dCTP diphosphatase
MLSCGSRILRIQPIWTNQMPTETLFDLTALQNTLQKFADERNWNQYHSPKNLAMALTAEVGELVEILRWRSECQSKSVATDEKLGAAVRDELADVFIYLARLAQVLGVDLDEV